jgi:outer membrane protein assembly factor BamB
MTNPAARRIVWPIGLALVTALVAAASWARAPEAGRRSVPMFGGTPQRNMANPDEKGLAASWQIELIQGGKVKAKARNIRWVQKLGSCAWGGPVVAGGRVFVSTNNTNPRDPKIKGDKGVVMCFRESDGKFLWQAVHDKLGDAERDYINQGIASTPTVDGDRVYYVNNRAEVVCADAAGDPATGKAKILWTYDMIKELEVFPCQLAASSPLVVGNLVYVLTGNGTDGMGKLPSPNAPSFIAVDKNKGTLVWKKDYPGSKVMDGQWSNPTQAVVNGKTQIICGGGDGWLYGLEPKTGELIWKFDCNAKKVRPYKRGGGGDACFIVATPVFHDGKIYVAVGQEPDDGPGVGHLWCVDPAKKPKNKDKDLSPVGDNFDPKAKVNKDSGLVWHYGGPTIPKPKDEGKENVFGRTISTVGVHSGLLYATELGGYVHCLDAKTGKAHWVYDLQDSTWCSPYYVDGRVLVGTYAGDLYQFRHGPKLIPPKKIAMGQGVNVTPVACNGTLFVLAGSYLYAIATGK